MQTLVLFLFRGGVGNSDAAMPKFSSVPGSKPSEVMVDAAFEIAPFFFLSMSRLVLLSLLLSFLGNFEVVAGALTCLGSLECLLQTREKAILIPAWGGLVVVVDLAAVAPGHVHKKDVEKKDHPPSLFVRPVSCGSCRVWACPGLVWCGGPARGAAEGGLDVVLAPSVHCGLLLQHAVFFFLHAFAWRFTPA